MSESELPRRRTSELRRRRISIPGARYFLTICAARPTTCWTQQTMAKSILDVMHGIHKAGDAGIMAATVMPDHVHLLIRLGNRLSLGQIVGKLKAKTKSALDGVVCWQDNFFEHRLREEDSVSAYARYIFLNPYRAHLISRHDVWPWWQRDQACAFDFDAMLENGKFPPAEWLAPDWRDPRLCAENVRDV